MATLIFTFASTTAPLGRPGYNNPNNQRCQINREAAMVSNRWLCLSRSELPDKGIQKDRPVPRGLYPMRFHLGLSTFNLGLCDVTLK
ncbi:hypothetical protein CEP51_016025 [Fusarium floridanum]|uniref:Uncharacterized protein n=2 Tax=Fusarium solani species complex TaxID=232080 RepID=A0A428NY70_9HYPO|nr:hypothetical protein CEP51_016025 [Fusarium floridanum]